MFLSWAVPRVAEHLFFQQASRQEVLLRTGVLRGRTNLRAPRARASVRTRPAIRLRAEGGDCYAEQRYATWRRNDCSTRNRQARVVARIHHGRDDAHKDGKRRKEGDGYGR